LKPHEFRILGPLEVRSDEGVLEVSGRRQRALLGFLLVNGNSVVSRERIVEAVWGEHPPASARNALQVGVHGLRKALGAERVVTQGTGYRLALEPDELDLARFLTLTERARQERQEDAAATLRQALELHRGPVLADLDELPFVAAERRHVEELRLEALERRIDAELALGRQDELVGELHALVAAHPYREQLRGQLMLALYRSGRQADALEQYRLARSTLGDELGLDPSRELDELQAAMLRQDESLAPPGAVRSGSGLPEPPRPLVGRELELAAVVALAQAPDARLVTLTGPGGTGKTRLALEAARELDRTFAGGAHFVDLAPLHDPGLVGSTAARALGVRDAEGEVLFERVAAALGERQTLLVLDNFEHVLDAAPLVAGLLSRVTPLRVLATSREPLRVRAEHEYRVPALALPARAHGGDLERLAGNEAVALFVVRARSARPGFELTPDNADTVVEICHALDGLPLALELAAARLRLLSSSALRDRLEDRLGILAEGNRDLPPRQRTLRAAIDWSYELLAPPEGTLLARLSVFAGGWTLGAAEAVCAADLAALGSLVEKSLVQATDSSPGEPRFSMLETLRQYAFERLLASGEAELTRRRHAAYFADLAERLEPDLHTARALDEAEREHDNIRAALEGSVASGDTRTALRICALARFWYVRGYLGEGRAWLDRALEQEGGPADRRAIALYWSGTLAWSSGDHESAIAPALESLALAQATGDEVAELRALMALGLTHLGVGDLVASRDFHAKSLALARALERDRDIALSLANLADIESTLGNHEEAEALARESLDISRRKGDEEAIGIALLVIASSLLERDRDEDAVPMIVESVRCFRSVDFKDFLASGLVALARARLPDHPAHAVRLLGAAGVLRAPLGPAQFPWEKTWSERTLKRAETLLGVDRARTELEAGASTPEETIESALAEWR
jgi:predicted ATPase/DNA-binding SARP family transcriptional activator